MMSNPHFRISYWAETQPFRDEALRAHFVDGYRKAGLPDGRNCTSACGPSRRFACLAHRRQLGIKRTHSGHSQDGVHDPGCVKTLDLV